MSLEVQQSKMQSLNMEWNNLKQQCWLDTGWVKRDNKLNMSKWCVLAVKKANHNLGYITKIEGNDPSTLFSTWEIHSWSAVSRFCVPSTGKTWTYEWWVIMIIQGWSIWCTRRGWGSWVFSACRKKTEAEILLPYSTAWWECVDKTDPDSPQQCMVIG